ncbi:uncharacterized protein Z518_01954 [Rhinocladiella mackenziei CBS 650.93]|uniref:Rhinocladiella mackenziei CBS 650.93 unplaced genomic scaffold supercont1.2, whole genome shotgun sequence n=1 Tax=Rhinocladiella mackenziei CBS 650.93 TaxID=1442369 RepID=A0A0D2IVR1_9EURO|nr:uncharacterized protein Z518_01954 [Rhinocladiella mackenziei CBS 650.93]KIX07301.1 hypothetical protein Z518_01954 [Rhinocladiella mackenziei CBS 650.93]
MSLTKISLKNLTARIFISPPPATLGESTAVLKTLQSFGPVTSFTKATPERARTDPSTGPAKQQEVDVVFTCLDTVRKACDASPFMVKVNFHLPDPQIEDPYNVRNLQSRKQPQPKTMTCQVKVQDEAEHPHSGQNILSSGFSPSNKTRLYQSILDADSPPAITDGLGVLHTDTSHVLSTAHLIKPPPDLMTLYRSPPPPTEPVQNGTTSPNPTDANCHESSPK